MNTLKTLILRLWEWMRSFSGVVAIIMWSAIISVITWQYYQIEELSLIQSESAQNAQQAKEVANKAMDLSTGANLHAMAAYKKSNEVGRMFSEVKKEEPQKQYIKIPDVHLKVANQKSARIHVAYTKYWDQRFVRPVKYKGGIEHDGTFRKTKGRDNDIEVTVVNFGTKTTLNEIEYWMKNNPKYRPLLVEEMIAVAKNRQGWINTFPIASILEKEMRWSNVGNEKCVVMTYELIKPINVNREWEASVWFAFTTAG